jgi:predicted permease
MRGALYGRLPLACAALKVVLCPAIGYVVAQAIGLGPEERTMALLFLATPTATVSYTLAAELQGNEALASSTILLSTVGSLASLGAILAWM